MNAITLRALRHLLFFTPAEAAALIGNMQERSWQYLESGKHPIPEDIIDKIHALCEWREQQIRDTAKAILDAPDDTDVPAMPWYATLEEFMATGEPAMYWRPHCSVAAEMCAQFFTLAVPAATIDKERTSP